MVKFDKQLFEFGQKISETRFLLFWSKWHALPDVAYWQHGTLGGSAFGVFLGTLLLGARNSTGDLKGNLTITG